MYFLSWYFTNNIFKIRYLNIIVKTSDPQNKFTGKKTVRFFLAKLTLGCFYLHEIKVSILTCRYFSLIFSKRMSAVITPIIKISPPSDPLTEIILCTYMYKRQCPDRHCHPA